MLFSSFGLEGEAEIDAILCQRANVTGNNRAMHGMLDMHGSERAVATTAAAGHGGSSTATR